MKKLILKLILISIFTACASSLLKAPANDFYSLTAIIEQHYQKIEEVK